MDHLFDLAIKRARQERVPGKNYFFSAIGIRKDGAVVFSTNAAVTKQTCPHAHAEARLVRKLGPDATVIVARVTFDGNPALAKPCPNCENLLRHRRVTKVYYTVATGEFERMRFS